jgi:hypothetical protein
MREGLPLFERLQIESQAFCNRACWFCPRTYDRTGTYLDAGGKPVVHRMATETILDLLDQAAALGFRGRVGFHHYSEPLLDPRNVELAREAGARGMQPYLHTNGDALRSNEGLCRDVAQVYGLIVVGLYDYRTNEELERDKHWWRERLPRANVQFSPIGPGAAGQATSLASPKALVPSDRRIATPDLTYSNAPCHRPLIRMIVRHDGGVSNCCEDTFGAFDLGSVHERSLADLWWSTRHVAVVTDLVGGRREPYALCRSCPLGPTGRPDNGRPIGFARRRHRALEATDATRSAP